MPEEYTPSQVKAMFDAVGLPRLPCDIEPVSMPHAMRPLYNVIQNRLAELLDSCNCATYVTNLLIESWQEYQAKAVNDATD